MNLKILSDEERLQHLAAAMAESVADMTEAELLPDSGERIANIVADCRALADQVIRRTDVATPVARMPRMEHRLLPTATDLQDWARRMDARLELPRLVRKLVLGTSTPASIAFPAGDSTQYSGWDGRVIASTDGSSPFVPDGESVWELSTADNVARKATADYEKRSSNPHGVVRGSTVYVAVTLRHWDGKDVWVSDKRAEGIWRDVRAYDAADLELWLEEAPAVHLWLARILGTMPAGAEALESFWNSWRAATRPALTRDVVLAGRMRTEDSLRDWLDDATHATLAIKGDTPDEAIAVVAATIEGLKDLRPDTWFARAIVVHDAAALTVIVLTDIPLLILGEDLDATAITSAISKGHRVVLAMGRGAPPVRGTLEIPRVRSPEAIEALEVLVGDRKWAQELGRLARGGMQSLRRELARLPAALTPAWVTTPRALDLVGPVLAGAWDESNRADQLVLERLSGETYTDLNRGLSGWERENDPPVRKVGSVWRLTAHPDTWALIAELITPENARALAAAAVDVLGTPDPRWDLPLDQRWMAPIPGKPSPHSPELHAALVESLALLALNEQMSGDLHAHGIVAARELFERASLDWRVWASMAHHLPDLAEIDPEGFLDAVERELKRADPQLLKLFQDDDVAVMSASPHTGLLWAFERLAWSPRYLSRVILILAELARRERPGKTGNRPLASLHRIFVPWYPQTAATPDERLIALDRLLATEEEVAHTLLMHLIPQRVGETLMPHAEPRWREWKPAGERSVSGAEYIRMTLAFAGRLVMAAGNSPNRWHDIVKQLDRVPPPVRSEAVSVLIAKAATFTESERSQLWEALNELVSTHRRFRSAAWVLTLDEVAEISTAIPAYEPKDIIRRSVRLFTMWPKTEGPEDWRESQRRNEALRKEAVHDVLRRDGLVGVRRLAEAAEESSLVGQALAQLDIPQEIEDAVLMEDLSSLAESFARGFIAGRLQEKGAAWRDRVLIGVKPKWTPEQLTTFLLTLDPTPATWDLVAKQDDVIAASYWQQLPPLGFGHETDAERAAHEYLKHGRPLQAVAVLGLYAQQPKLSPTLIVAAIEAAIASPDSGRLGQMWHNLRELLNMLADSIEVPITKAAQLEWALLPILGVHDQVPKALALQLATDPRFFVELCSLVYRAEGEEPKELDEAAQRRWSNARHLLEAWKGPPGGAAQETRVEDSVRDWVREARKLLLSAHRLVIGDIEIGQLLARATAFGESPSASVSDAIDDVGSPDVERGFSLGVMNSRGVFSKGWAEGGKQERELAARYRAFADRVQATWPRTAAALREVEGMFLRNAEREDLQAEQHQDRF